MAHCRRITNGRRQRRFCSLLADGLAGPTLEATNPVFLEPLFLEQRLLIYPPPLPLLTLRKSRYAPFSGPISEPRQTLKNITEVSQFSYDTSRTTGPRPRQEVVKKDQVTPWLFWAYVMTRTSSLPWYFTVLVLFQGDKLTHLLNCYSQRTKMSFWLRQRMFKLKAL